MLVQLDKIADEPFRWSVRRSIPAEALDRPDLTDLGEIDWRGEIRRDSPGFWLEGRLTYSQTLACSRCLAPIVQPIESRFEFALRVGAAEPMVGEVELTESDLSTVYLENEQFDTEPILLEQLQLNIPMRLVCRDDCAGLCPTCGVNRNTESCTCESDEVDPRWEALKGWPKN